MGITVHQSPTGYASAHEEVWHVVESTDKNLEGFQYIYDIYKGATLLTRVKNTPPGANKVGVLDVGNIVRSSLDSFNFPAITANAFTTEVTLGADVFWTEYSVRYGQATGFVEISGNITSGTYRVYNNYKRAPWDKEGSALAAGIASNRPAESYYYEGEPVVLSMFVDDFSGTYRRTAYSGGVSGANKVYSVSGNYKNAFVFSFMPSGSVAAVRSEKSNGGSYDTLQTFTLNKKCSKYETHTLVFLNAFGVYDSFTFVHGKFMMTNEKKRFEQMRWQLSSNSMVEKSGAVYNESAKAYAVKYKEKMMLTSDVLSTGEYNWLSELINSPQVYYYSTENAEYYPVQVMDTDYEFKDARINKADTLSITIEFSTPQNTQYR